MANILGANYTRPQGPWVKVFTYKPIKINNKWHWLTYVYKREKNRFLVRHQGYEFGTIFDVLRDS